ncbi:MAG: ferritin-like domain-containing protein [Acetobacteraceae bacterium]
MAATTLSPPVTRRSAPAAFAGGAVIGALGGLIGLGGAEFRLPLLIGMFRFGALQAVILNKAMSLVVVAGMQRIEHYEIAAYGTDIALARALGEREVVDLLSLTLEEEKQTDRQLSEVTEQHIMPAALGSDETAEKEPSSRNKASGGHAKAA